LLVYKLYPTYKNDYIIFITMYRRTGMRTL